MCGYMYVLTHIHTRVPLCTLSSMFCNTVKILVLYWQNSLSRNSYFLTNIRKPFTLYINKASLKTVRPVISILGYLTCPQNWFKKRKVLPLTDMRFGSRPKVVYPALLFFSPFWRNRPFEKECFKSTFPTVIQKTISNNKTEPT